MLGIGGFCLISLLVTLTIASTNDSYSQYSSYDLCDIQQYMTIADDLDIDYYLDYNRLAIGLNYGNGSSIEQFQLLSLRVKKYSDAKYANASLDLYPKPAPHCQLSNVKHHVIDMNERLLPYIPNDVEHVSYHPKEDKAVYCYYLSGERGGSQCFYIRLKDGKLIKDDISDLERVNLALMVKHYPHVANFRNKAPEDFNNVHSAVIDWTDTPPNLRYGITLATYYDYHDMSWAVEHY